MCVCVRACVRACVVCSVMCVLKSPHLHVFGSLHHPRFPPYLLLQDQYVFIHDALADYITCGNTSIIAQELLRSITEMTKVDQQTKKDGFTQQFQVITFGLHCTYHYGHSCVPVYFKNSWSNWTHLCASVVFNYYTGSTVFYISS